MTQCCSQSPPVPRLMCGHKAAREERGQKWPVGPLPSHSSRQLFRAASAPQSKAESALVSPRRLSSLEFVSPVLEDWEARTPGPRDASNRGPSCLRPPPGRTPPPLEGDEVLELPSTFPPLFHATPPHCHQPS